MSRHQDPTFQCECGASAPVERISSHEFHAECPSCGRITVLSWAHHEPAPTFDAPPLRLPLRSDGAQ